MEKVLAVAVYLAGITAAGTAVTRNIGEYGSKFTPYQDNPYHHATQYRTMPQYGGRDYDSYSPAYYQYKYDVAAPEYGTQFGHQEARQGDVVQGRYYLLLADGRTQVVDYVADQYGYRPKIRYLAGLSNRESPVRPYYKH